MGTNYPRKVATILVDESHSMSWTISLELATEINPVQPANSSYAIAASVLSDREFNLLRNVDRRLSPSLLKETDLLVLPHPCDPKWERTTSSGSPKLTSTEIRSVKSYIDAGGALLVIAEYEHDKYGDNLNDLLVHFGLTLTNDTVSDPHHNLNGNPTWVFADKAAPIDDNAQLLHLVAEACFYRAGRCATKRPARAAVRSHSTSKPPNAPLISVAEYGAGRVCVVTDSDLFGDEYIDSFDHRQLWINVVYWLCLPAFRRSHQDRYSAPKITKSCGAEAWNQVKATVNSLRVLQQPSGSIAQDDTAVRSQALTHLDTLATLLPKLSIYFPHQADYLAAVIDDLKLWRHSGLGRPDFTNSLSCFNPQLSRRDGLKNLAVFPMYTPNASLDVKFEALAMDTFWPEWLSDVQATRYRENTKFVPARLSDFTDGYASECAVFFPEAVSVAGTDENRFGIIFCGREAQRYQHVVQQAITIVKLSLPPNLSAFLSNPGLILDTYALWDLIHDTSHSRGELPFDPFMVRQKSPFWMYALEELRVDMQSFLDAHDLSQHFPFAEYVCHAVLFDRIFRFAITGTRVRNYDALAGQLLFTALHSKNVIIWRDNVLSIEWAKLASAVKELHCELQAIYRQGQVISKVAYWSSAHDLLCQYLTPNVASKWAANRRNFEDESDPKSLVSLVNDDEFPLGSFHLMLERRLNLKK